MDNDLPSLYLNTTVLFESNGDFLASLPISLSTQGPIHVITAWNPGDERPSRVVNEDANNRLRELLSARGLHPIRAVGKDPDSHHFEESWAVVGLTDDEARRVGLQFGQVAVFRIDEQSQTVLSCDGTWERTRQL